jgi:hypothetical protein
MKHNSIDMIFLKKLYTIEGFEPWSSVPEADVMSSVPYRPPGQLFALVSLSLFSAFRKYLPKLSKYLPLPP